MGDRNPNYIAMAVGQDHASETSAAAIAALAEEKRNENLINFIGLGGQIINPQVRNAAIDLLTERLGLSSK